MSEYKDKQIDVNKLTLARARELLGNTDMPDAELEKVLENLRTYCSIVYEVQKKLKQAQKEIPTETERNTPEKNKLKDAA